MQIGPTVGDKKESQSPPRPPPLFEALLSLQKGDGVVLVGQKDALRARITVLQGRVVAVEHQDTEPQEVLHLLQQAGVIEDSEVSALLQRYQKHDDSLLEGLVATGLVRASTVDGAREFLCHEVLLDLLLRPDVEVSVGPPPSHLIREMCAIPVRFLLREVQKRALEIPEVRKIVPRDDLVFAKTGLLSRPASRGRWIDLHLSHTEKQVFAFVDGRRTVADIARLTCLSPFSVAKAIKSLLAEGLVRQVAGPLETTPSRQRKRNPHLFFVVAFAVALAVAIGSRAITKLFEAPNIPKGLSTFERGQDEERVHQAALIFSLIHGKAPRSIDDLIADGLITIREGGEGTGKWTQKLE